MSLVLNEDQRLLRDSAMEFVKKESPVGRVRALRDARDPDGYSSKLWTEITALGWPAIHIPDTYGGLGMGATELACVFEAFGRTLVPEPLYATAVLGATALIVGGTDVSKQEFLPAVTEGRLLLALAHQERDARNDLYHVATTAEPNGDGFRISGEKTLVADGHIADKIVVVARLNGAIGQRDGLVMGIIDRTAPGVDVTRQSAVDSRNYARVTFDGAVVEAGYVIGQPGAGADVLDQVHDTALIVLSAEALGGMQAAFEMTLDYLKTRKQFGVVIGTFQGLKHRAAKLFIEIELAKSSVMGAVEAIDADRPNQSALASAAKARCSDAYVLVTNEAVQMHGGIGMTDEHDIGFYMKRARSIELTFGDASYHRARFATLSGF